MPTPNRRPSFHPDFLSVELTNHCKNDSSKGYCPSAVPPPPPPLQQHTPLCAAAATPAQSTTFSPLDLQFHVSAVWKGVNNSNPQHGRKQRDSLLFNHILYNKHCCTWWLMPAIPKFENLRQEEVQERAQDQPELHIKTYHSCTHTESPRLAFYNKATMLESRACK